MEAHAVDTVPAGQRVQFLAPGPENMPAGHISHCPAKDSKLPARQDESGIDDSNSVENSGRVIVCTPPSQSTMDSDSDAYPLASETVVSMRDLQACTRAFSEN